MRARATDITSSENRPPERPPERIDQHSPAGRITAGSVPQPLGARKAPGAGNRLAAASAQCLLASRCHPESSDSQTRRRLAPLVAPWSAD